MKSGSAQPGNSLHLTQQRLVRMIRHPRGAVTLPQLLDGQRGVEEGQLAVVALKRGLVPFQRRGVGMYTTFAEACCVLGRVDVLRAVVELGIPGWEFKGREHTRRDWLETLCSYQNTDSQLFRKSLFKSAATPVGSHTRDALILALEYQPDHPDIDWVREKSPECAALMAEAAMYLRLRQVSATGPPTAHVEAPMRRAKAL